MSAAELSREARAELRSLTKETADTVARHLVMAGRLLDEDPEQAYAHAFAARRIQPRLAVVREASGLCAYANGRWAEALAELRASRRISGSSQHLAIMADCERGLGRPERALALASSQEVNRLDRAGQIEMRIVASGARRDLGQPDAAVVALQGPDLDPSRRDPWSARLFYAYADALLNAGRPAQAREWFLHAALADLDGTTDAAERVDELDGAHLGGNDDVPSSASATEAPAALGQGAPGPGTEPRVAEAAGAADSADDQDPGEHAADAEPETQMLLPLFLDGQ